MFWLYFLQQKVIFYQPWSFLHGNQIKWFTFYNLMVGCLLHKKITRWLNVKRRMVIVHFMSVIKSVKMEFDFQLKNKVNTLKILYFLIFYLIHGKYT